jgi:hypothetical protein
MVLVYLNVYFQTKILSRQLVFYTNDQDKTI